MARPHVPQFGNWENDDKVPYTVYFDKARQGRSTGKMINPNDPQENPELFTTVASQAQPKPLPPKFVPEPEPIVRGPVRPNQDRRTNRDGEFKQYYKSPGRTENMGRRNAQGGGRGNNSARPVRQSVGSEYSIERSPLHPHYQAKVAGKGGNLGNSSPSWDGKSSYDSSHGTPDRSRMRPANRGRDSPARAAAVPKFGDWDENKPSSGDGYTVIFNKVREERQTGAAKSPNTTYEPTSAPRQKYNDDEMKACCFPWGRK